MRIRYAHLYETRREARAKVKGPMMPPEYARYFMTMAAVGATLFGLIFVMISIAPESIATASAPLEWQVRASTAYIALINPLIISLYALVPHQQIGTAVLALSLTGLSNPLIMAFTLLHHTVPWSARVRNIPFILLGFLIYGYETFYAVRLLQSATDRSTLNALGWRLSRNMIYVDGNSKLANLGYPNGLKMLQILANR